MSRPEERYGQDAHMRQVGYVRCGGAIAGVYVHVASPKGRLYVNAVDPALFDDDDVMDAATVFYREVVVFRELSPWVLDGFDVSRDVTVCRNAEFNALFCDTLEAWRALEQSSDFGDAVETEGAIEALRRSFCELRRFAERGLASASNGYLAEVDRSGVSSPKSRAVARTVFAWAEAASAEEPETLVWSHGESRSWATREYPFRPFRRLIREVTL